MCFLIRSHGDSDDTKNYSGHLQKDIAEIHLYSDKYERIRVLLCVLVAFAFSACSHSLHRKDVLLDIKDLLVAKFEVIFYETDNSVEIHE